MAVIALIISLVALATALMAVVDARELSKVHQRPETPAYDDTAIRAEFAPAIEGIEELRAHYAQLSGWQQEITMAVGEGIKHVDRVENRVRATVRRAQEKLAEHGYEHPALEAEANELREVDGSGSDQGELLPVPENVAPARNPYAGIPGHITDDSFVRLA